MEPMDKVLVLTDDAMHESVSGIVAGRVRDAVNRPVVMLALSGQYRKGSGRSIEKYDLFAALYRQRDLFLRFGGHAMAAGMTLEAANVSKLREALNADCNLTDEDLHPVLKIDRVLEAEEINLALSEELARLAPFGKGNREPVFASFDLIAESVRVMDEKNTLIFTFVSGKRQRLKGIAFGLNEQFARMGGKVKNQCMDAAYYIEMNVYNGLASVQIRLRDFKIN
jgi:single-stranded-DNA-specific exonuclease